jgi:hypothetical protein
MALLLRQYACLDLSKVTHHFELPELQSGESSSFGLMVFPTGAASQHTAPQV